MGPLGWQETVFIFVLALLLFGPRKLPELGKTIGKALTEFRRASNELKSTFDREMANLEHETAGLKESANRIESEIRSSVYDGSSYDYNYNYYDGYDGYQPYEAANSSSSTEGASATQDAGSNAPDASVETAAVAVAEPPAGTDSPAGVEGTVAVQSPGPAAVQPTAGTETPQNA